MNVSRTSFAIIYVLIDIVYISITKGTYFKVVQGIQNQETKVDGSRYVAGALAYILLAVGWYVLVAPPIEASTTPTATALLYGAVYGASVYGVFNFTNYVMFQKYTPYIMAQDMIWGVSWVTILSLLYATYITQQS